MRHTVTANSTPTPRKHAPFESSLSQTVCRAPHSTTQHSTARSERNSEEVSTATCGRTYTHDMPAYACALHNRQTQSHDASARAVRDLDAHARAHAHAHAWFACTHDCCSSVASYSHPTAPQPQPLRLVMSVTSTATATATATDTSASLAIAAPLTLPCGAVIPNRVCKVRQQHTPGADGDQYAYGLVTPVLHIAAVAVAVL